ncbi:MAG: MFS transporter, partial [Microbacterium sp.]
LQAGLALVPGLAAMVVSGLVVVPIASRVSPRVVIPVALVFSAAGYVMVAAWAGRADAAGLILAFVSLGLGIGAAETVSNELVLASAPPAKAGAASAVSETAYEIGSVLGTSVLGGILTAAYRAQLVLPAGLDQAAASASRETLGGAYAVAGSLPDAVATAVRDAASAAFDSGAAVTSLIGAGLVLLAAAIAATTLGGSRTAS